MWVIIFCNANSVFVVFQSLSHVQLFATPWTAARQASLSFTMSRSLLKLISVELVMPSNHLNLCHPLLLLPSIFPSIRVFSSESALHIRWPKYWSFSFSISPLNNQGCFPLGLTSLISLLFKGLSRVFSSTTFRKRQFFAAQPSLWPNSHIHTFVVQSLSCVQLLQPHELQHTRLSCPSAPPRICSNSCPLSQ